MKLKVFHGYGSQENEVQIDKGEGFCYHDCTSSCRHNGCNCECPGEFHIPKNEIRWSDHGKMIQKEEHIWLK